MKESKFIAGRVEIVGKSKMSDNQFVRIFSRDFTSEEFMVASIKSYREHGKEVFSKTCDGDEYTDLEMRVNFYSGFVLPL